MNNDTSHVWIMVVLSFIIGYVTMPILNTTNTTCNLNKIYSSLLMAFLMGVLDILIMPMPNYNLLGILILMSIVTYYLWKNQIGIDDKQFYLSMIEHHQMALEMARPIQKKSTDPELKNLTKNIITSQQKEIDFMWKKLKTI